MSQIKLDPITQLAPIDPIALGLELLQIQTAPTEPFGHHLQRAKTHAHDMPSRDVADRPSNAPTSMDRMCDDRVSDDRAAQTDSESHSAADTDTRDSRDAANIESRDASTDQDPGESALEKPATEEQGNTDRGEQADSVEAEGASSEEAETPGDGESGNVDVAIGAEKIKADLPTETNVEVSRETGNESESAKIATDGAEATDPAAKEAVVSEEQASETLIATATTSNNAGSGEDGSKDADDGKSQQASAANGSTAAAANDSTVAAGLDQSDAKTDSPGDRPRQEAVSGEDLAEENAAQTDATAHRQQVDGQDSGTEVSTKQGRPAQSQTEAGQDGRSTRQEKKPIRNASTKDRVADVAPQQQTGDDPTTVSVDLKSATIEPIAPVAGPQVDTADGSVKPVSGSVDNQTSGAIRTDSARPGRVTSRAPADAAEPQGSDQARFVGRVARAFEAMGDRNGPIRLKLSPAELGSLRIEISVRGGTMTAHIEAETSTARNLLLDNLPALRDRLTQQGIKIDRFDVDLSDRSTGGLPDQRPDHADSDDHREGRPMARADREETDREEDGHPAGPTKRPGDESQLNVIA